VFLSEAAQNSECRQAIEVFGLKLWTLKSQLTKARLLNELGYSLDVARTCRLYQTDDLHFKRDFKLIDGGLSSVLRLFFALFQSDCRP